MFDPWGVKHSKLLSKKMIITAKKKIPQKGYGKPESRKKILEHTMINEVPEER